MATPTPVAPVRDDRDDATIQAAYRTVFDPEARRSSHRSFWTTQPDTPKADEDLVGKVLRDDDADVVQVMNTPLQGDADSGTQHQNMTQVQVVRGRDGSYTLFVDGVQKGNSTTSTPNQLVEIQRFRGPHRDEETEKTMVGPVAISLMTESDQRAPDAAVIRVIQKTTVDGIQNDAETVLTTLDLPHYSVNDYRAPCVTLPFPAWFTEPPYIEVDDVYDLRRFQSKRFAHIFLPMVIALIASLTAGAYFGAMPALSTAVNTLLPGGSAATRGVTLASGVLFSLFQQYTIGNFLGSLTLDEAKTLAGADPQNNATVEEDRANLLTKFMSLWAKRRPQEPRRGRRKYQVRGLTRSLQRIMNVEQSAALNTDSTLREQYKDESVLADWLLEPLNAPDLHIPHGSEGNGTWPTLSGMWDRLESVANDLFGKIGLAPQESQDGRRARGIIVAAIGKPSLAGLDVQVLRKNHVSTQIEISIYDSSLDHGDGSWTVRVAAEARCGFQAGWFCSGTADDVDKLVQTVDNFTEEFCNQPDVASVGPTPAGVAGATAVQQVLSAVPNWWVGFKTIRRSAMCANKVKLLMALYAGDDTPTGMNRTIVHLRSEHEVPPPQKKSSVQVYFRKLPQRFVLNTNASYVPVNSEQAGVYAVSASNEATRAVHPVDGAVNELRRHLRRATMTTQIHTSRWEASTVSRNTFYQCYVDKSARLKLSNTDYVALVGAQRMTFTNDGIVMPLQVRDVLTRIGSSEGPDDSLAIGLISTPITRTDTDSDKRKPFTHYEVVGRHAYADVLISRLLVRGIQHDSFSATMGADADISLALNPIVEMFKSCQQEHSKGYRGIMSQNDIYFQCFPFGADLARIIHACGTWTRNETLSTVSGVVRIDRSLHQRLSKQNLWPSEAETHVQSTITSFRRISRLPQSHLPVYALQNTLSMAHGGEDMDSTKAMLICANESFERTLTLCALLGLGPLQTIRIARLHVLRWPVLLSVRLRLAQTNKGNAEFQQILGDAVRQKSYTHNPFPDPGVTLFVNQTEEERQQIRTSLQMRAKRLCSDLGFINYPEVTYDTTKTSYHVPFAHGDRPYSITRTFSDPGNEHFDSVPIHMTGVKKMAQLVKDANAKTGGVSLPTISTHSDHPFLIRINKESHLVRAECYLSLVWNRIASEEGTVPVPAPPSIVESVWYWLNPQSRKTVSYANGLTSTIVWNTERLVQTILLMIGNGDWMTPMYDIGIDPPDAPVYKRSSVEPLAWERLEHDEARRSLRRAIEVHIELLFSLFRSRDQRIRDFINTLDRIMEEVPSRVRRKEEVRKAAKMAAAAAATIVAAAQVYALAQSMGIAEGYNDSKLNNPTIDVEHDPLPQQLNAMSLKGSVTTGAGGSSSLQTATVDLSPAKRTQKINDLIANAIDKEQWTVIYYSKQFTDELVEHYGVRMAEPSSTWGNDLRGLVYPKLPDAALDKELEDKKAWFKKEYKAIKDQTEKAAVLAKLKSANIEDINKTSAIFIDDVKMDFADGYNRQSEIVKEAYETLQASKVNMQQRVKQREKEERELKERVTRTRQEAYASLAASAVLAGSIVEGLVGWMPRITMRLNRPEDQSVVDAVLTRLAAIDDKSAQESVALVEACTVMSQLVVT